MKLLDARLFLIVLAGLLISLAVQGRSAAPSSQPATSPASGPATQPAKELTLDLGNNVSMKLVLIPSGKFMMGSTDGEKDRSSDEGPRHEVTISKPFYIGATVVTQAQYEAVMGKNPSNFKGPQNPVEWLSWDDAVAFCNELTQKTGKTVSLPTEAQWEYACRAGSQTRFMHGDDADYGTLGDYAWYVTNSDDRTHPVGQKKPNAWGLYDMNGNVWQWCADWYDEKYYANADKTDPAGPDSASLRVLRGGAWYNNAGFCRSACRFRSRPDNGRGYFGLRVVADGAAGMD